MRANQIDGRLEKSINEAEAVIEGTLSVANARDVLTWDRSVINPRNWSLPAEGVRGYYHDLTAETLYNDVVHSAELVFGSLLMRAPGSLRGW